MYSPIAKAIHTASELHQKLWLGKTLQEYIQNFRLYKKAMDVDPDNVTKRVIIFLFI